MWMTAHQWSVHTRMVGEQDSEGTKRGLKTNSTTPSVTVDKKGETEPARSIPGKHFIVRSFDDINLSSSKV